MQRLKRECDEGSLNVAVTAHQLLQPPVLPHCVVPTLLCRTVACYLPVAINAPEEIADVDANAARALGEVATLTEQRVAAQGYRRVLAILLDRTLVAKQHQELEADKDVPATSVDTATGDSSAERTGDDTDDDTDDSHMLADDSVGCLEMEPAKVELARSVLPAAVRYERWCYEGRSRCDDDLPSESYCFSVAIEGMRAVAVASMRKKGFDEDVMEGEHRFAVGPVAVGLVALFDDELEQSGPTWRNATFTATSELEFDEKTYKTKTSFNGGLEAAGSAARALLFPKSPLRVFTDRELGFLVALAVTVERPNYGLDEEAYIRAVGAPGMIRDVLRRKD